MNRTLAHIISFALCLFFLIAGTGWNAVHYCCEDCREAGLMHVVQHESCEHIHHTAHHRLHHHDGDHACGCCDHHDTCWFCRLSLHEGGISSHLSLPEESVSDLLFSLYPAYSHCIIFSNIEWHALSLSPPDPSPDVERSGQAVLRAVCCWLV